MKIDIPLPSIADQQATIYEAATEEGIARLRENIKAPRLPSQTLVDESLYSRAHLLRWDEGWEAPHAELVKAYFRHFQDAFPEYGTDKKLAHLLGIHSSGNDRRIRAFKDGSKNVPYSVWRHFLVITGRVPQDILPVLAFMA
ncbi:hypothetical protein NGI11_20690 [Pseudomonas fulva]|nr:hypothetical protein [Pseudomonas fulva]MEB8059307.1 hypothetical protein [Pseudomonas fulva]